MAAQPSTDTWSIELEDRLVQLRDETMRFAEVGLLILAVTLLGSVTRRFDPLCSLLAVGALVALIGVVWLVRRWSDAVTAWLLIADLIVVLIWVMAWSDLASVLCLLARPRALAALLIGVPAGLALAAALSMGILFVPAMSPGGWFLPKKRGSFLC